MGLRKLTSIIEDVKFIQSHEDKEARLVGGSPAQKLNFSSFGEGVMVKRKLSKCARSGRGTWGDMLRLVQQQETN